MVSHRLVGVGLRSPHFGALLTSSTGVDFVEVHAENHFAEGGLSRALLERVADTVPVSLHGTGSGLASKVPIPLEHLRRLRSLVEWVQPTLVSDHVAQTWFAQDGQLRHAGDLLPVAFDRAALRHLVDNIRRVQDHLGRQIFIENLAQYLVFAQSDMPEVEFLAQACENSGCGLLVDLNNLHVNAINAGEDEPEAVVRRWLDDCPADLVKELHLAGSTPNPGGLVIDDHAQPVSESVWVMHQYACQRFPQAVTLIEWDEQLPSWSRLLQEADRARESMRGLS
jgi:uncharacterized protein